MFATLRATVLTARTRQAQDGKTWADVYLLQEGRREPIVAYADPAELIGGLPTAGESVECEVLAYAARSGGLSVRIDACRPAPALV